MDIIEFFQDMGFMQMTWQQGVMLLVSFFLLYLAIHKKYEPLLLLPIAFGMLLTNLPGAGMFHDELWTAFLDPSSPAYHSYGAILKGAGLLDVLYIGVKAGVYPCLIFIGVGAMTDIITVHDYLLGVQYAFNPYFVWYAIIKALVFAFVITSLSSYYGYFARGGALDVGRASTNAVVNSNIMILFLDLILSKLLL